MWFTSAKSSARAACAGEPEAFVMSIAEFYIENGIDPGDPDSFDAWMHSHSHYGSSGGAWAAGDREDEEDEQEELMMHWEDVKEVARGRLRQQNPDLSREQEIEQAEKEADDACLDEMGKLPEWRQQQAFRATATQQASRVQQDRADSQGVRVNLDASEIEYMAMTSGWEEAGGTMLRSTYARGRGRLEFDMNAATVMYIAASGNCFLKREFTMAEVPSILSDPRSLTSGSMLLCASCTCHLSTNDFSSSQRKKREARRCKVCVGGSDASVPSTSAPAGHSPQVSTSGASSSSEAASSSLVPRLLWRGLRADEVPGRGLTPRAPGRTTDVRTALENGSQPNEFVHMTDDPVAAVFYAAALNTQADPRVVLVDSSKLSSAIIRLSTVEACATHGIVRGSPACNFACSHHVVLVQGNVPPEAIVAVRSPPDSVPRGMRTGSLQHFRDTLSGQALATIKAFNPRLANSMDDEHPDMLHGIELSFQHLWMNECAELSRDASRFTVLMTQFYDYCPGRFSSELYENFHDMLEDKPRGDVLATIACEWHISTIISKYWHDSEPRDAHVGGDGRRMPAGGPTAWVTAFLAGCTHLEQKYTERELVHRIRIACASASHALGFPCSMSGSSKEGWPTIKDAQGFY